MEAIFVAHVSIKPLPENNGVCAGKDFGIMRMIAITDTTLRDGEQTPGVRFGVAQKLDIALRLEKLGVDCIEAGFPASSAGDAAAVAQIARAVRSSTVCALARCVPADIYAAAEALRDAVYPRIHIFLATSAIHMEHKLHITRDEALRRIRECTALAVSLCPEVQFSPEDATRTDPDFLIEALRTAAEAGAHILNIPDTVGYTTPAEFGALIARIGREIPGARLGVHCHNDLGMATANSLAAVEAGALQVECTVNGLGERAGNAALCEIVMALSVRRDVLHTETRLNTREITDVSRLVSSLSGVPVSPNKAIVGANVFTHESGIHQHGVMQERATYEIMRPEDLGRDGSTILLGKLSGRHAYTERVRQMGYSLDEAGLDATFARFKEVADRKSTVSDEDIRAIISEYLDSIAGRYRLVTFQIQSGNHIRAMALVTLSDHNAAPEEAERTEAAPGEGPVDAAFNAIRRIADAYSATLVSYEIRAVTEGTDALGEAIVKIRTGESVFTGRGVSTDVIKASIKAYLNAVNKWDGAGKPGADS